jgi:hypothetical protein
MKYMLKPPFYLYLVVITCKIVLGRYRIWLRKTKC